MCLVDSLFLKLLLTISSSGLSFILSTLVIYFILKKDLFRAHSYKILIYISINDLLRSVTVILENLIDPDSNICSLYGFLDSYFFASNPIWAFCLTFTIFQIIVLEETNFEKFHKFWVFFIVFVVGGIVALPFSTQSYAYYGEFCLISNDEVGNIWRFSILYFPISIIFGINFVLYFKILKKVKGLGNISLKAIVLDRGMIYTLIILVSFIPLMIIRVVVLVENSCKDKSITFFIIIFYNLQGFFNGITFFYNRTIRLVIFQKRGSFNETMPSLQISFASVVIN